MLKQQADYAAIFPSTSAPHPITTYIFKCLYNIFHGYLSKSAGIGLVLKAYEMSAKMKIGGVTERNVVGWISGLIWMMEDS